MTIQSVKITNLYGNNYEWHLNPDVNILVGANGTYKSTILVLIKEANKDDLYFFGKTRLLINIKGDLNFKWVKKELMINVNPKVLDFVKGIFSPKSTTYYPPSDGEQSLIDILNSACPILDSRQLVLFLDNPENNLHIDWQRNLIKWIRELNPTCQIIMTTHSPNIYYQKWIDKVTRIEEIKIN